MRSRWSKRVAKTLATLLALVGLLAVASWYTTVVQWEGGYPAGAIRLEVRSADNQPISGATFEVYDAEGNHRDNPFLRPIGVTDQQGKLTIYQPNAGIQFGGERWWLFWTFRMGDRSPRYECELAATGFKSKRIGISELFELAQRSERRTTIMWGDDQTAELAVYDANIMLDK